MKFSSYLVGLLLLGLASGANAQSWYDGQQERRLYVDQLLRAQIDFPEAEASTRTASAQTQPGPARIRLVRDETREARRARTEQAASSGAQLVPVYRDFPHGPLRVASGGVLLRLPADWSLEQQAQWLAQENLAVINSPNASNGYWLVASPPGEASLALAAELFQQPEVISASPNWWQPRVKR